MKKTEFVSKKNEKKKDVERSELYETESAGRINQFKLILNLTAKIENHIANSNSSSVFSLDLVLPNNKAVSKMKIKAISEILKKYPQIKSFSADEYSQTPIKRLRHILFK